jgi:hypothetical protein
VVPVSDARLQVIWFEDAEVLPVPSGWRSRCRMSATRTPHTGHTDPDWVRLLRRPGCEVWYDLENGIVFRCTLGTLQAVVALIQQTAATSGLRLANDWPATSTR